MSLAQAVPPAGVGTAPPERAPPERFDEPAPPAEGPGLLASLQALVHELPGLVSDRVKLVSLELRRAAQALVQMLMLAVAAAILGVTAWLAVWVGIGAALIDAGMPWGWALLIVIALNLGAAFFAVKRALALVALLGLPATVRRLTVASRSADASVPNPSADHGHHFERPVAR